MRVKKGGISREISESRIQEYKDKGYKAEEIPQEEPVAPKVGAKNGSNKQ